MWESWKQVLIERPRGLRIPADSPGDEITSAKTEGPSAAPKANPADQPGEGRTPSVHAPGKTTLITHGALDKQRPEGASAARKRRWNCAQTQGLGSRRGQRCP